MSKRLVLLVILLIALAVRLHRLDGQSLWYDEGTSVALAARDLPTIVQSAARDIHPPLYYLVLSAWVRLVGNSEIAVRLLSALAGVLTVWLTYLIGRRLFGHLIGLLAALLAALSPFLVYYSQEARMYMLATLLCALSMYILVRAGQVLAPATEGQAGMGNMPGARSAGQDALSAQLRYRPALQPQAALWWASYILVTAAALYTHYFSATVMVAQVVAVAVWGLPRRRWQPLSGLVLAQAVVALLYLPWLPVMAGQFQNWPAISEFYNLPTLVSKLFPIFSLGLKGAAQGTWPLVAFAVVLLAGMVPGLPKTMQMFGGRGARRAPEETGAREAAWAHAVAPQVENEAPGALSLVVCWLVVPVLIMFALSLRRPLYNPKFLVVAAPAFALLLARGLVVIASWAQRRPRLGLALGGLLLALLLAATARSLHAYYYDPQQARDDYRGLARAIQSTERSEDGIILNAPGQTDIFGYYYRGQQPVYPLPQQRPLDEAATAAALQAITNRHRRLWVVYYGDQQADPGRFIESWLDARAFKASDRWFGDVRLVLYALAGGQEGTLRPLNMRFGDDIVLLGYRLGAEQAVPGDIVPLTLVWQARGAIGERYTVFAHIVNSHDALWGQHDGEPAGGLRPTTTWQPGEAVQDNHGLPLALGTPPGDYQIEVGLYRPTDGARLPIVDSTGTSLGDRLLIGPLRVVRPAAPPTVSALAMQQTVAQSFGGLRLLGYSLGKLGEEPGAREFGGNDILHLTLFWQAEASSLADMVVSMQVLDGQGQVVRRRESRPVDGDYPTSRWSTGEVVRDQHRLPLAGLGAGQYRLRVETLDASGKSLGQAELGMIVVK